MFLIEHWSLLCSRGVLSSAAMWLSSWAKFILECIMLSKWHIRGFWSLSSFEICKMGIQFLWRSCRFKKLLSKFVVESATITPWVLTKARFVCLGDMCVHLEICASLFFRHSDVTGPRHYRAYYSQLGAPVLEMGFSDKVLCSICGCCNSTWITFS